MGARQKLNSGYVNGSLFFAALAGGFLATHFRGRQVWSGVVFLVLTIVSLLLLGVGR